MKKRTRRRFLIWLSVFASAISIRAASFAQTTASNLGSSIDLTRYFKSAEDEKASRAQLTAALDSVGNFKGQVTSGSRLLAFLQSADVAQKLFARHDDYLYLRCAINRKDDGCDEERKLNSSSISNCIQPGRNGSYRDMLLF